MTEKESLPIKIFHVVLKVAIGLSVAYLITTEYGLRWYLRDHYKTTIGTVVAKEGFSNGGVTYRYEYAVNGVKYSETGISKDDRNPPIIGKSYSVKYLEIMPSISVGEY